ncbi:uncharacterized protein LOC142024054 isoform X2 [Carettochelys insculpta]|uniref:uncharacterized protein LOC142024054 isoform X2 n=1 Tax=Carettochelys insculpta TaxID=44489 RepID=UPI003EBBC0EC
MNCILATFLLLILLDVAQPCPPICKYCSTGLAECEHVSSLREVLSGLPNSTEKILLRHGNLREIPTLSFQNFPQLHLLSITGFLFSSLPNLTFVAKGISSLKSLDLSSNSLVSCGIEPLAFSGLGILEELILTNNALDTLKSSWFLEMSLLTKLLLSNNKITYLPPRTFESLPKLNELIVSSNFIRYLSMDTFYGLASLTKLDLSSNEILFINDAVFQPLQALTHLWLFKNKLTALSRIPDSLIFLSLYENPWTCNCHLVSSMQLLREKVQTPTDLVCDSPASLKGHYVLSIGLEVCTFPTPPGNLPQQSTSKFNLLYGFAGGLFFSFILCLIFCFFIKHWKYSRVTNRAVAGHVLQRDSGHAPWELFRKTSSVSPLPRSSTIKVNKTGGFLTDSKADTIEKVLHNNLNNTPTPGREYSAETSSPVKMPGVAPLLAPSHAALVKYFETHCEEQALNPIACFGCSQYFRTSLNVVSPAESAMQTQTGIDRIPTTSNKRSKSWSLFHFSLSSHLTEAHGESAFKKKGENGLEAKVVHSTETDCEHLGQEQFTTSESTDTTEDKFKDQGMKDSDLQKNVYFKNCCIAQSVRSYQRNTVNTEDSNLTSEPEAPANSPLSDLASPREYAGASNPDDNGARPEVEGKLVSPFLRNDDIHPQSFCNDDRLGEERPSCRISRNETPSKESSLKTNKLTQKRFWNYHTNCCNEYQPCPIAQKVLKELKAALLNSREQLDPSMQAPPSDVDLLKEQESTTIVLGQHVNNEEPLANKWEKGTDSTLPDVHASITPDGICPQELPGNDNFSCGLPLTITLHLGQQSDTSHQEVGAECWPLRRTIAEPINECQKSTQKCVVKDQSRVVDSLEQEQLANDSSGANHPLSRRCENASNEHVAQDWKSLDVATESVILTQAYNAISEHSTEGEEGWVTDPPGSFNGELCHVKSGQLSTLASVYSCLPLSAGENTQAPDSRTSTPNTNKVSVLDIREVERKGVADVESNRYLSNEVISVQKTHTSPSKEGSVGRLRDESADAEFLLHADEETQLNIDETEAKMLRSDCNERHSYELVEVISSNDTGEQKSVADLSAPNDNMRTENNTWCNTDGNTFRSYVENACHSISANCNACDDAGCKKETGHEHLCQTAASKGSTPSANPVLAVHEIQAEEISVTGYDGRVSPQSQASSAGIQQFTCNKKDKFPMSHRSFPQQASAQKEELEQNWNESPSASQSKRKYCSVFRLPTEGPSFGKLCQSLDCAIDLSELNKTTSLATPCLLAQGTQLMEKTTYLNCLYNPKMPRKQANELSILSNLRYCKVSAKVPLGAEEEAGRTKLPKKKNKKNDPPNE